MQISTTARHCELAPELRASAQERLGRCERFANDIREARLIVTAEKFRHIAEIKMRLDHHELVSSGESPEMRLAIDRAIDGLEEQLRRFKDRRLDRRRDGVADRGTPPAREDDAGIED